MRKCCALESSLGVDENPVIAASYRIIAAGCFDLHRSLATPAAEIMRG
jgi:hypothetical protein